MTQDKIMKQSAPRMSDVLPKSQENGAKQALSAIFAAVFGFFFGGITFPMEARPAGIALVSALPSYSLFAAIGVFARSIYDFRGGRASLLFGTAALLLSLFRYIFGILAYGKNRVSLVRRLPDSIAIRGLIAAIFAMGFSLIQVLRGGITLADALFFAVNAISTVSFALLLCFFFESDARFSPAFEAGLGAAAFLFALSLADITIDGFSVGLVAAFALTLYTGWLGNPMRGAAVGLLCGLACGGIYAPVFALAGLVAGIFFDVNCLLAAAGAASVMLCGALYFGELATVRQYLPEIVTAILLITIPALFRILPSFSLKEKPRQAAASASDCAVLVAKKKEELRDLKMERVAGSMSALSEVLRGISDGFRRPEPELLTEKCLDILRRHCESCPNECPCHDQGSLEIRKMQNRLASRLMTFGKIDRDRLYEITKSKCPKLDEIAREISECAGKMLADAIRNDNTKFFAQDYEAMAELFADAAAESSLCFNVDAVLSDRVRRRLRAIGLPTENLVVCGDRKKYIIATGEKIASTSLTPDELRLACESACGVRFSPPEFLMQGGKSGLILESTPRYTVEYSGGQRAKKGEIVCGDSVSVVRSDDDYFNCFICDGMGSGKDAALTSHICRVFLEKMLVCGNKKSIALDMLNHLIQAKGTECFATVDLVEIDLALGMASFIKSGAVPSYVIREGRLYKIASGTMPIGIVSDVSAEITEFELRSNDVILLCSDGVASDIEAGDAEDPTWFLEFLGKNWTDDLSEMAERILSAAERAAPRTDDMTVELIRVREIADCADNAA